ncbi:MAG TPA: hypothetical protein VF423_02745 [Actinomycetes bacterium]
MSGVLGEAWRIYRAHAGHLITIAFAIYAVGILVGLLLTSSLGVLGDLLGLLVLVISSALVQAALVHAVHDIRDGRADLTVGATVQAARPVVGRVAVASILAGVAIGVGLVLLIVPGLILFTLWAVIVPVLVLERVGVGACFGRSMELVRGHGWQVFWPLITVHLVLFASSIVIELALDAYPDVVASTVGGLVTGTVVSPFVALVVTLAYFRLRAAKGIVAGDVPRQV